MTELEKGKTPTSGGAIVQAVHVEFNGPLPHPQVLVQYNDALPDGANRIVKLAENQVKHRQALESRAQIFTFVLAAISLVGGIFLIAAGDGAQGLVPLAAATAGLGGLFLYREITTHRREKELWKGR